MTDKPCLILHTTAFADRAEAFELGQQLYDLLTRPVADPLAWGAGVLVRSATEPERIDCAEAMNVVIVPVLDSLTFQNAALRDKARTTLAAWIEQRALVLPVLQNEHWGRSLGTLTSLLSLIDAHGEARRHTLDEILIATARRLASSDKERLRLFISHARDDLEATGQAAEKIRELATRERTVGAFFDRVSVLPGEELGAQIDAAAGRGVFIAVRSDRYSSRIWCRRELLKAKQRGIPTLMVEVLSSGEARSGAYSGNGPSVVWSRKEDAAERVVTLALSEAVRHLHFHAEADRVLRAADLPPDAVKLSRPPELLDVPPLRDRNDARLIVIHPDPPLPAFERAVLEEADKRLLFVTPTTAFWAGTSSIQAPLEGHQVAFSLSPSPDAPEKGGPAGLTEEHLKDAITFVARALIGAGAALAYGGDLRRYSYTRLLAPLVVSYNETARRSVEMLHAYLGVPIDPAAGADLPFTLDSMRGERQALLEEPQSFTDIPRHRQTLYFSDMRRFMTDRTFARVLLGGNTVPASRAKDAGYLGRYPGAVEEAWRSLECKTPQPLYVAGGFGGAAALVAQLLSSDSDDIPELLQEKTWATDPGWNELTGALDADTDVDKLGLPKTQEQLARKIRELGRPLLASDAASIAWNGLDLAQNRLLFRTRDPLTIAALVVNGLIRKSLNATAHTLRIELVEDDVTAASDLEVLAFGTFDDVQPGGAARPLDRVSGGAALTAYRTRTVAPARSSALGINYLFAAPLGSMSGALRDAPKAARDAADATVALAHRLGFRRIGLVTFLGNVGANLGPIVQATVDGLCTLDSASTVVWFERDPVRAAIVAAALESHPNVTLTRRAPKRALVTAETATVPRTTLAVRHERGELDVGLLLPRAIGIAPNIRSPLADALRNELAGSHSDSAPARAELERRGSAIVELVFGKDADAALREVRDSELQIMHDADASALPYEAMGWDVDGRRVHPALEGGVVRHLLAYGVHSSQGAIRPPRAGKLDILIVINPKKDLDGAQREGDALVALLSNHEDLQVHVLSGDAATRDAVIAKLDDPAIDLVHYCGHAYFEGPGSSESGLVLADGNLTLERVRSLRSVPRLAFFNACQGGRVRGRPEPERKAQAFAEFFLRSGVEAYLGTFWLVSDSGAASFAATVYEQLLQGSTLRDAVLEGRRTLEKAGNSDWANYLLYGYSRSRLVFAEPSAPAPAADASLETSVRVEDTTIVASWSFPAASAPVTFSVAALDAASSTPIELKQPVRVERREVNAGPAQAVTWVATLVLPAAPDRALLLSPSDGEPIEVPPTAPPSRAWRGIPAEIDALRTAVEQQPDGGISLLRALHPSAEPHELRGLIERSADGQEALRARPPIVDDAALAAFVAANKLDPITAAQAMDQRFQTKEDWLRYVTAKGAVAFTLGATVQKPRWIDQSAADLTFMLRDGELSNGEIEVALFADNANDLYASNAILRQIVNWKPQPPYAFYLGDVYYGGQPAEFDLFRKSLDTMFDRTELFMISGNHEMYAEGGKGFQQLLAAKADAHSNRQRQRAEMFRLTGDGFQILGIDTMYVGWNSRRLRLHDRADERVNRMLDTWLDERPHDLTILMTANEPWDRGSTSLKPLYQSLRETIAGRVDLWFWGNVHYAALYEPWTFPVGSPARRVIGSCIGHGGYPYYTEKQGPSGLKLPESVHCRWIERKSRFWPDARIRPDVGANGWCKLKLKRSEQRWNIDLTFVDWVGRDRLRARLVRDDGQSIDFEQVQESDLATVGGQPTWTTLPRTS